MVSNTKLTLFSLIVLGRTVHGIGMGFYEHLVISLNQLAISYVKVAFL